MRRLLEQLQREIDEFIEQRDDLVLMLCGDGGGAGIVLKILRDFEQLLAGDVFLMFGDDFVDLSSYAQAVVDRVREEHRMACEGLTDAGRSPLPPFPEGLHNERREPLERIHQTIGFCRSLVPRGGDHRLIVCFCPMVLHAAGQFQELVESYLPRQRIEPWMRGLRIVVRADAEFAEQFPGAATGPRLRCREYDFSQASIEESLSREAEDESLPDGDRVGAIMQLAAFDFAYHRSAAALDKYDYLLGFFQQTENEAMQAHVMSGKGDVFRRDQDYESARHWYECALSAAIRSESVPSLQTVVRGLGELEYEAGDFARSERYFDQLLRLGEHNHEALTQIHAHQWKGLSLQQRDCLLEASQSFQCAADLCRRLGLTSELQRSLAYLETVYERSGAVSQLAAVRKEQQELAEEQEAGEPEGAA